ncbi:hypothetical protein [Paenibacillus piri]|uniref:Uncharacterized protein n=1 Tax=Paenibacillus piri TaxID=2547395 RepID=A0A4R5KTX1_9BACL|nr:hypothetical protein [Paenibacillus piri]TDF98922.1 hypothetical protein E1757_10470 [Paenibacillus piri]
MNKEIIVKNQLQAGTKTNAGNRSISISDFVVKQLEIRRQNMLKEKAAAGDDYEDKDFVIKHWKGYLDDKDVQTEPEPEYK